LGPIYSNESTTLKVWAPLSSDVEVNLYTAGHTTSVRPDGASSPYSVLDLTYTDQGVWEITLNGDMHGVYYTFNVVNDGVKTYDIQDPYGQTFGLNGARSMIIDMSRVNPEGWDQDSGVDGYTNPNEAIIYELHVRDLTSDSTWNGPSEYRNTYMGLTVDNTSYTNSISNVTVSTGLAHLKELGITHLHLLPTYDQDWNDERNFQFNWGYNPQNYNSPEGGYSTNPYDGAVRVNEYKQMVMALHDNGINVINDVVYNHTGPGSYYSFNRIVPGYFYRYNSDGSFLNASGVGNTTASERYMVSKFIVDSVEYWAKEYHIDGFRFDLMRIHDVDTMNALSQKVEEFDQDIFVYGEPWAASDDIGIPYQDQAAKHTLVYMPLVAAFNDNFRNAIKGSPDGEDPGYVTNGYNINDIKNGISGSQNWDFGNYTYQSINYVTAHDNLTLYDKLLKANNTNVYSKSVDYQARLSNSIVMFSQGTPFLHAGVDFLRSKGGNHNSYDAPDSVNQLDYSRKSLYNNSFEYYKGIIEIRKAYDSFKMYDYADINQNLEFLDPSGYGMIGYRLTKNNEDILVYFHGGDAQNIDVSLPGGAWELIVDRDQAGLDLDLGTYANTYPIEPYETLVFVKGNNEDVIASPDHEEALPDEPIITNTINKITVGGTFRLNVDRDVVAYQIDNGEYITVNETDFIYISGLEVGTHFIRVKTADGGISTAFALIVEDVEEITCDQDPTQDKCQTEEPIVTCEEDPNQDKCQIEEPVIEDTGCFAQISNSITMISSLSLIGIVALIVIRKKIN
jgi:pullulanase